MLLLEVLRLPVPSPQPLSRQRERGLSALVGQGVLVSGSTALLDELLKK
jgi:hypothetical protein